MVIKKKGNKFGVYSHKTGKLLGTYDTRAEANKAIVRHKIHKSKNKK